METKSPDPLFVAAKSSVLEGVNALVINALVNDLAGARVQIQSLEADLALARVALEKHLADLNKEKAAPLS